MLADALIRPEIAEADLEASGSRPRDEKNAEAATGFDGQMAGLGYPSVSGARSPLLT
jgi:hypothetical protein